LSWSIHQWLVSLTTPLSPSSAISFKVLPSILTPILYPCLLFVRYQLTLTLAQDLHRNPTPSPSSLNSEILISFYPPNLTFINHYSPPYSFLSAILTHLRIPTLTPTFTAFEYICVNVTRYTTLLQLASRNKRTIPGWFSKVELLGLCTSVGQSSFLRATGGSHSAELGRGTTAL
jgi:hypothetical protein